MAKRTIAKQSQARNRARELAAATIARQEKLLASAADYLVVKSERDALDESLEAQCEKIRADAEKKVQKAWDDAAAKKTSIDKRAAGLVHNMLDLAGQKDVAERLGETQGEIRRLNSLKTHDTDETSDTDTSNTDAGETTDETADAHAASTVNK